jgi:hypothetical protein
MVFNISIGEVHIRTQDNYVIINKVSNVCFKLHFILKLFIKYSKDSTKTLCLFKTRNKVVEVR